MQAPISLMSMGIQDLQFLSVRDSDASTGVLLVARSSVESPASSTTNWAFGGATMTWDGSADTNWNNPANYPHSHDHI